jgi:ABC-2 type transport system ATP-binding protein
MLRASHLTRRFGTRLAVDDVSFELEPGEIFGLLGPNGAGKTTTLRLLAGLIAASSGSVSVNGETMSPESAPRLRAHIGFLTESPGLWDRLSVRRNLLVYARLQGLSNAARVVDEALDLFDIRDRAMDSAAELSKGLRQRVALARTLLHRPGIVLLDEPTSGLDPESARDVRELILRLRTEQRQVILSTHNLDEVERIANRVGVLKSRLIAVDTPAAFRARLFGTRLQVTLSRSGERFAEMLRTSGLSDVRVDGDTLSIQIDSTTVTPVIVRKLVAAGADIESIKPETPRLEQIYLRLLQEEGQES